MHSDTPTPEPTSTPARRVVAAAFEVAEIVRRSVTILRGMEIDGLIETQDGETYRITDKGKAQAALHREGAGVMQSFSPFPHRIILTGSNASLTRTAFQDAVKAAKGSR